MLVPAVGEYGEHSMALTPQLSAGYRGLLSSVAKADIFLINSQLNDHQQENPRADSLSEDWLWCRLTARDLRSGRPHGRREPKSSV